MLAKVKELGDRLTGPVADTPVPAKLTVCGLPVALSVIESFPVTLPVAVGLNVTLMVQLAPAARLVPQLLV